MKWTTVSKSGKQLRTWDTADDGPWLETIFSAVEGNIFSRIILAIAIGIPILMIIIWLIFGRMV